MTQDTEWRLFNSELELGTLPAPTTALFLMRTVGLVSVSHSDILTYQTLDYAITRQTRQTGASKKPGICV